VIKVGINDKDEYVLVVGSKSNNTEISAVIS
jgi:hypothetical protein